MPYNVLPPRRYCTLHLRLPYYLSSCSTIDLIIAEDARRWGWPVRPMGATPEHYANDDSAERGRRRKTFFIKSHKKIFKIWMKEHERLKNVEASRMAPVHLPDSDGHTGSSEELSPSLANRSAITEDQRSTDGLNAESAGSASSIRDQRDIYGHKSRHGVGDLIDLDSLASSTSSRPSQISRISSISESPFSDAFRISSSNSSSPESIQSAQSPPFYPSEVRSYFSTDSNSDSVSNNLPSTSKDPLRSTTSPRPKSNEPAGRSRWRWSKWSHTEKRNERPRKEKDRPAAAPTRRFTMFDPRLPMSLPL